MSSKPRAKKKKRSQKALLRRGNIRIEDARKQEPDVEKFAKAVILIAKGLS